MVYLKIKKIDLIKKLDKYIVFNLKIVKDIIEKNNNYAKLVVYRLKKEGLIYKIEKNKYTTKKNPIAIASHILWPSYISCWSALRYYNLTEQLPQVISIITTRIRKKRKINFYNTKIIFIKTKSKYFFGYKKERYGEVNIFIAEKEKALIDSLLFKKISFSELSSIIKEHIKTINIDLFLDYLIKIRNKTLIKRFGFLLDSLNVSVYERLKKFIDFKYIALDYALAKRGKKDKKWRIIKNANI